MMKVTMERTKGGNSGKEKKWNDGRMEGEMSGISVELSDPTWSEQITLITQITEIL